MSQNPLDIRGWDWHSFRKQRLFLLEASELLRKEKPDAADCLEGITNWLEDICEEGEKQGEPVLWMGEASDECNDCHGRGWIQSATFTEKAEGARALGDGRQWCKCQTGLKQI